MAQTITEKIFSDHCGRKVHAGDFVLADLLTKVAGEPLFTLFTTYSNKPFSWLIVWRLMAEVRVIEVSVMATLAQ